MAGIPLFTASPINTNAAKATGITPSTLQPSDPTGQPTTAYPPATTTASSSNPPARPGPAPYPVPTGTPQPTSTSPTQTAPPAPTQRSDGPPPPQPGAVPSPFATSAAPITRPRRPSIPPPPKAGETAMPAAFYAPHYEPKQELQSPYSPQTRAPPPQTSDVLSTPIRAIPPSSTTSTPADTDHNLSHPPGYLQNSHDSFDQRPEHMQSSYTSQNYGNNAPNRSGLLGSDGGNMDSAQESPMAQIWNTATSWAKAAGEKLKEGEEEMWRRINKG